MNGDGRNDTVLVNLWDGQQRGAAQNAATLMFQAAVPARVLPPRELFTAAYEKFATACREVDEPGLAVIAVDERSGRPAGIVRLLARVGRPVAAIVGRHDRCDLYLAGRDQLALRQLAIVLDPVTSWQRGEANVCFRMFDLRTSEPMIGEDGKKLHGLVADGPAIVRCGGYAIFALPLGDPSDWPMAASDAWEMLPPRVYLDELAEGSLMRMPGPSQRDPRATYITRTHGPRSTGMRLVGGSGDAVGELVLSLPHRQLALQIGAAALRDGVLIGRYHRCDGTDAAADDISLSRVHALLVRAGDRVLLVDTASSNGTHERGAQVRLSDLENGSELRLGTRTYVRWRVVS